jgi:glutathione synthase/RimK-type ligase-like ATP-grasp enzyme
MSRQLIHVIHENEEWVVPLRAELEKRGLPYTEWDLSEGSIDLDGTPPEGVFYNRMSASSHTRGHTYAPELTAGVLAWLEAHGRRVINGRRALQLEVSKVEQYLALNAHGIRTPKSIAAVGRDRIVEAARKAEAPFITKHNRAGKGLGVHLFHDAAALEAYVDSPDFEDSRDGVTLIQQYVEAPEPFITRAEFVGGKFLYAVRVNTSEGFELCPADVCSIGDAACPVGVEAAPKFSVIDEGIPAEQRERYEAFLAANDIQVAGIEFIADADGTVYTYDVNTNTNYNSEAEAKAGVSGMGALAEYLGRELASRQAELSLSA